MQRILKISTCMKDGKIIIIRELWLGNLEILSVKFTQIMLNLETILEIKVYFTSLCPKNISCKDIIEIHD